jgi:hypothetical protein
VGLLGVAPEQEPRLESRLTVCRLDDAVRQV